MTALLGPRSPEPNQRRSTLAHVQTIVLTLKKGLVQKGEGVDDCWESIGIMGYWV